MRISDWSSDVCSSDLEIHKSFKPFFVGGSDEEKKAAGEAITRQFTLLTGGMKGDYLFGAFSVADPFLFVMLRWAFAFGIGVPEPLIAYRSEEHTSELQSLMRISYAVFCLKKKKKRTINKA